MKLKAIKRIVEGNKMHMEVIVNNKVRTSEITICLFKKCKGLSGHFSESTGRDIFGAGDALRAPTARAT